MPTLIPTISFFCWAKHFFLDNRRRSAVAAAALVLLHDLKAALGDLDDAEHVGEVPMRVGEIGGDDLARLGMDWQARASAARIRA